MDDDRILAAQVEQADPHRNFAFLGQYTEIPEDVVFTVEYSVRGATHAVYELLGIDRDIPDIYHALTDPNVAWKALKTAFR